MARHAGRESAFVAHRGAHAFGVDDLLECMKHLAAIAHRFAKTRRTHRNDHQLLQVEVVVCMRAAIDHIHHRYRHLHRARAAEVAVQRQARLFRCSARHRHAHGERRVGAQAPLVVGAVQINQGAVQERLLTGVQPHHGFRHFGVDVLHRLQHPFAAVARFVAVAQLDRLARTGRCARGHGRSAHRSGFQQYVALHRGVAAAVEDFAADDVYDCAHSGSSGSGLIRVRA